MHLLHALAAHLAAAAVVDRDLVAADHLPRHHPRHALHDRVRHRARFRRHDRHRVGAGPRLHVRLGDADHVLLRHRLRRRNHDGFGPLLGFVGEAADDARPRLRRHGRNEDGARPRLLVRHLGHDVLDDLLVGRLRDHVVNGPRNFHVRRLILQRVAAAGLGRAAAAAVITRGLAAAVAPERPRRPRPLDHHRRQGQQRHDLLHSHLLTRCPRHDVPVRNRVVCSELADHANPAIPVPASNPQKKPRREALVFGRSVMGNGPACMGPATPVGMGCFLCLFRLRRG